MSGWKTITGSIIVALSQTLQELGHPYEQWEQVILAIGVALAGTGIAHKLDKIK
jgi:hypothetical protein